MVLQIVEHFAPSVTACILVFEAKDRRNMEGTKSGGMENFSIFGPKSQFISETVRTTTTDHYTKYRSVCVTSATLIGWTGEAQYFRGITVNMFVPFDHDRLRSAC